MHQQKIAPRRHPHHISVWRQRHAQRHQRPPRARHTGLSAMRKSLAYQFTAHDPKYRDHQGVPNQHRIARQPPAQPRQDQNPSRTKPKARHLGASRQHQVKSRPCHGNHTSGTFRNTERSGKQNVQRRQQHNRQDAPKKTHVANRRSTSTGDAPPGCNLSTAQSRRTVISARIAAMSLSQFMPAAAATTPFLT